MCSSPRSAIEHFIIRGLHAWYLEACVHSELRLVAILLAACGPGHSRRRYPVLSVHWLLWDAFWSHASSHRYSIRAFPLDALSRHRALRIKKCISTASSNPVEFSVIEPTETRLERAAAKHGWLNYLNIESRFSFIWEGWFFMSFSCYIDSMIIASRAEACTTNSPDVGIKA